MRPSTASDAVVAVRFYVAAVEPKGVEPAVLAPVVGEPLPPSKVVEGVAAG